MTLGPRWQAQLSQKSEMYYSTLTAFWFITVSQIADCSQLTLVTLLRLTICLSGSFYITGGILEILRRQPHALTVLERLLFPLFRLLQQEQLQPCRLVRGITRQPSSRQTRGTIPSQSNFRARSGGTRITSSSIHSHPVDGRLPSDPYVMNLFG